MKKVFCDVCGREIQIAHNHWTIEAKCEYGDDNWYHKDICKDCADVAQDALLKIINYRRNSESRQED
jgi:hypothetical protein